MPLVILLGVGIGVTLGLLGGGGSILAVPAVVGERFSDRLPGAKLSRWFAYLVVGVALFVLIQIFVVGDQIVA